MAVDLERWRLLSPEMAVALARDGCCSRQRWPLPSPEMDVTSPEMAVTARRITSPEMAGSPAWNPRKAIFAHIIRLYRRIGLRLGGGLSRGRAYPTFAVYSLGVSSVLIKQVFPVLLSRRAHVPGAGGDQSEGEATRFSISTIKVFARTAQCPTSTQFTLIHAVAKQHSPG